MPDKQQSPSVTEEMVCGDCGWRGRTVVWRTECRGFPCELNASSPTSDLGKDEELVRSLRLLAKGGRFPAEPVVTEAAARIEALLAERERLRELVRRAGGHVNSKRWLDEANAALSGIAQGQS